MIKNFKKYIKSFMCILLSLVLLVALCSCAGNVQDKKNENTTASIEETVKDNDDEIVDSTTAPTDENKENTETLKPDGGTTDKTDKDETEGEASNETTTPPEETKPAKPDNSNTTEETKPSEITKPTETTHSHKYTSKITKNANCTSNGEKKYTCECGDSYTEVIKATGHSYTLKTTKNATCTNQGFKEYVCSCGNSYKENINKLGHDWGEWKTTKEPTTSSEGNSQRKCKRCTATENKPIAKLPPENPNNNVTVSKSQLAQIEEGFLMLVNLERNKTGAGNLTSNAHLETVAQTRSSEAITTWSHTRPNGQPYYSLVNENEYRYIIIGENLCMTSHVGNNYYTEADRWTGSSTQIEAAYSWIFYCLKNSPGHYANMINKDFKECGIGISYTVSDDGIPMFYVAHIFGAK